MNDDLTLHVGNCKWIDFLNTLDGKSRVVYEKTVSRYEYICTIESLNSYLTTSVTRFID